jgi:hypothetical protein
MTCSKGSKAFRALDQQEACQERSDGFRWRCASVRLGKICRLTDLARSFLPGHALYMAVWRGFRAGPDIAWHASDRGLGIMARREIPRGSRPHAGERTLPAAPAIAPLLGAIAVKTTFAPAAPATGDAFGQVFRAVWGAASGVVAVPAPDNGAQGPPA